MRIAIGSDEKTATTDFIVKHLRAQGHKVILFGALVKPKVLWPVVAKEVAEKVRQEKADEGLLFCWTGTGVAMVASKIPGIRAVTISDEKTAKNARKWDHANILAMSCFLPKSKAKKIVDVWFKTKYSQDPEDKKAIEKIKEIELEYLKK